MAKTLFVRTVPSAGLVHFGLASYSYAGDGSDIQLPFECTAARAREIADLLIGTAGDAEIIASKLPYLAPLDAARTTGCGYVSAGGRMKKCYDCGAVATKRVREVNRHDVSLVFDQTFCDECVSFQGASRAEITSLEITSLDPTLDAPPLTDDDAPDDRFTTPTYLFGVAVGYDIGWDEGNQVGYDDGRDDGADFDYDDGTHRRTSSWDERTVDATSDPRRTVTYGCSFGHEFDREYIEDAFLPCPTCGRNSWVL